jgi:hypothetical protein
MSTGSAFMRKMRRGGVTVRGNTYTNIVTEHDELVSPCTSGIETGMRDFRGACRLSRALNWRSLDLLAEGWSA